MVKITTVKFVLTLTETHNRPSYMLTYMKRSTLPIPQGFKANYDNQFANYKSLFIYMA